MKMLIAPMVTVAETGGSITRTRALALQALTRGHDVALPEGMTLLCVHSPKSDPQTT